MWDPSRSKPSHGASVVAILAAVSLLLLTPADAVARERGPHDAAVRKAGRLAAVKKPRQPLANTPAADKTAANKLAEIGPAGSPGARAYHAAFASRAAMQAYERHRTEHRSAILAARSRLPPHPLPGERGFTGVPPVGEKRFVSQELVFHVAPTVSRETVDNVARKLGLSTLGSHSSALTGGTLFRFRVAEGRSIPDAVRALEAEKVGIAQPNYVFKLQEGAPLAARTQSGDSGQYVVSKLGLGDVHRVATGSNVLVAVIDSEIDLAHPDLAGALVERFDAVGRPDKPHVHGTGMTGAIVAHRMLKGVAPAAKILAVHAFSPEAAEFAASHHSAHPRRARMGDQKRRARYQHELCRSIRSHAAAGAARRRTTKAWC